MLITVGSVTGVSITALFVGGLLPAVVGLVMMAFVVWFQTRNEDMTGVVRYAPRQIVKLLDHLIDDVGEKEDHPLDSMMEALGVLIENYEDELVAEPA